MLIYFSSLLLFYAVYSHKGMSSYIQASNMEFLMKKIKRTLIWNTMHVHSILLLFAAYFAFHPSFNVMWKVSLSNVTSIICLVAIRGVGWSF